MKILYASDLDRTLIFSQKFISNYATASKYTIIEKDGERIISYIANRVLTKLKEVQENRNITFIPITTRSLAEYSRIEFGFTPEYAVTTCGGIILHNGKRLDEWEYYVSRNIDTAKILSVYMDMMENLKISEEPRIIDGRYIMIKIKNSECDYVDQAINSLALLYNDMTFTRNGNKLYIIPKAISKQVALRWLKSNLNVDEVIASGDSMLDIPMFAEANKVLIPDYAYIVKDNYVLSGRIISGGILSPIKTMDIAIIDSKK